jgi:Lon protease-like protein
MLPDGRSLISTVGIRKFKILDTGNRDGYMTAKIEYIDDEEDSENVAENSKTLEESYAATKELLHSFLQRLPYQISHRLMAHVGPIPEEPSILPYWVMAFMQPFGISEQLMTVIYAITKPKERMTLVKSLLLQVTAQV